MLRRNQARGTSEPGPFGSIVGDPLVKAVTVALLGSRGYAVQVGQHLPWYLEVWHIIPSILQQSILKPLEVWARTTLSNGWTGKSNFARSNYSRLLGTRKALESFMEYSSTRTGPTQVRLGLSQRSTKHPSCQRLPASSHSGIQDSEATINWSIEFQQNYSPNWRSIVRTVIQ
jgi:hypothetical protein